ncbi:hypothetical protein M404DRAFT_894468 [Pisolithus tinctorius Marx 270]|uniref:Uncharacterized protein n=1 Tax=Pisolithus tinctorius Marx 270 TaxID=870435 RepID=A0A0C3JIK7_PISTI|nr:hypothetical protein M404DRAFT_894468 [Pisolithus tinctorius Marx 270]
MRVHCDSETNHPTAEFVTWTPGTSAKSTTSFSIPHPVTFPNRDGTQAQVSWVLTGMIMTYSKPCHGLCTYNEHTWDLPTYGTGENINVFRVPGGTIKDHSGSIPPSSDRGPRILRLPYDHVLSGSALIPTRSGTLRSSSLLPLRFTRLGANANVV